MRDRLPGENHCLKMRGASCGYWLPGTPSAEITRALEIAEGGATPGIDQRLNGGVRMRRRVADLRDVVHRGDAVVELAEPTEQLIDVDVLRPVHRGKFVQDELVVSRAAARRAGAVVDKDAVREVAAQRRFELVVMRIDEAGHHDAPGGIDHVRGARRYMRPDGEDRIALDQDIGLGEVAHIRIVHRHHRPAANDVAPVRPAAVLRWIAAALRIRRSGTRCEEIETCRGNASCRSTFKKIAPRAEMVSQHSLIAKYAHACVSPREPFGMMALQAF